MAGSGEQVVMHVEAENANHAGQMDGATARSTAQWRGRSRWSYRARARGDVAADCSGDVRLGSGRHTISAE
jgi:hypothetical protein